VMASVGGVLALLAGVGLSVWMASGVIRQIGGEPAYARAAMQRIAGGDLTGDIQVAGGTDSLLGETRSMNERLRSLVGEISNGAATVRDNALQILESSRQIAGAADRQSDSTADVAAAVEELTVSVNHISDNARDTENSAARSNDLAAEGQKQVQEAAGEMRQIATGIDGVRLRIGALAERANEVGSIAQVIKEIAGQTNLLALNAAIEAARAGEQGRGFAVVADEVRALAERTAAATQKIETMIGAIQGETLEAVAAITQAAPQVQRGVELSQNAAETLREIRTGAQLALERVRDVANATAEQSTASTVIATRIESIAQQVDSTGAATRHAEDQANSLQQCADGLLAAVARFRV
jgi:methyl-accepting chemotaxis protein